MVIKTTFNKRNQFGGSYRRLLPIDSPNIEAKMLIENHEVVGTILNLKRA